MILGYDILKKAADNNPIWLEAVDKPKAKKWLISLVSTEPGEYRLWDSSSSEFINYADDCASKAVGTTH